MLQVYPIVLNPHFLFRNFFLTLEVTRVSQETGSSTGLFLFINNLQTFKSQEDIWMISDVNESKSLMYALWMV